MANDHIVTLNGKNPASCTSVFREHFAPAPETNLLSDSDDQLIIHIAFSSVVKVKAVELFTSGLPQEFPVELKIYANAPKLDFTTVETAQPAQVLQLSPIQSDSVPIKYPLRAAKFFNVSSLCLFFTKSVGGKRVAINYINFEGEFSQSRIGVVKTSYESKPQIVDHATDELFNASASRAAF